MPARPNSASQVLPPRLMPLLPYGRNHQCSRSRAVEEGRGIGHADSSDPLQRPVHRLLITIVHERSRFDYVEPVRCREYKPQAFLMDRGQVGFRLPIQSRQLLPKARALFLDRRLTVHQRVGLLLRSFHLDLAVGSQCGEIQNVKPDRRSLIQVAVPFLFFEAERQSVMTILVPNVCRQGAHRHKDCGLQASGSIIAQGKVARCG